MNTPSNNFDEAKLKDYPLTFSFAAAGWLQMYHFGVGKALQDCGVVNSPDIKLAGSSAGSLAATAIACGVDMDEMREYAVECSNHCRSKVKHAFMLREYVLNGVTRYAMNKFQQDPALKEDLNRKLEVYATVLPWCHAKRFEGCFETPEDLGEALAASCCLTPIAGFPFQLRATGEWVCDGGVTNFQPRAADPNVVTINALYPLRAHIKPSCFIPIWWGLYPPAEAAYRQVFDVAYNDAVNYLVNAEHVDKSCLKKLRVVKLSTLRGGITNPQKLHGTSSLTSWVSLLATFAKDSVVVLTFLCVIRPMVMFLIYLEIVLFGALCMLLAFFHESRHSFWWACDKVVDLIWGTSNDYADPQPTTVDGIPISPVPEHADPRQSHNRTSSEGQQSSSTRSSALGASETDGLPPAYSRRTRASLGVSSEGGAPIPRFSGPSRKKSNKKWYAVYQTARNLLSFRTWIHLNFFGDHVPINNDRLEKSSKLYRLLRPMVYDRDLEDDEKIHH